MSGSSEPKSQRMRTSDSLELNSRKMVPSVAILLREITLEAGIEQKGKQNHKKRSIAYKFTHKVRKSKSTDTTISPSVDMKVMQFLFEVMEINSLKLEHSTRLEKHVERSAKVPLRTSRDQSSYHLMTKERSRTSKKFFPDRRYRTQASQDFLSTPSSIKKEREKNQISCERDKHNI